MNRTCGYSGCDTPLPTSSTGRPRKFCCANCKAKDYRRRRDPRVGLRTPGPSKYPLWLELMMDALRQQVQVPYLDSNGNVELARLRPETTQYTRWFASCMLLNPNLSTNERKEMTQYASLSQGELRRLQRRLTRIENVLADYASENLEASRKVRQRLDRVLKTTDWESETIREENT